MSTLHNTFLYFTFTVKVKAKSLSRVQLFVTLWTVAYQAPPSMGFSRQEYCSGLPFPPPGDLPDPGIKPGSPALEADALASEPPGKPITFTIAGFILSWAAFTTVTTTSCGCCLVTKLCPTLCNPTEHSMPGSPVLHYLPHLLRVMSIELVMLSNSSSAAPFFCLQSSASGSFPVSLLFISGAQNTGASASAPAFGIFRTDFL